MSVQPSTNIRLLRDIPLDNSYTNTLWFDTTQDQLDYFNINANQNGVKLTNQTYQRVNKNRARVDINVSKIYDVNYMMFQNTGYNNKWFYAFILSVEYVNDSCTEIEFEIDVFQTYMFDFMLGDCYVEREHVIDDSIGANTTSENLEIGEYCENTKQHFTTGYGVAMYSATSESDNWGFKNNVFSSLSVIGYDEEGTMQNLREHISMYNDVPEAIAMITMISDKMVVGNGRVAGFTDSFNVQRDMNFTFKGDSYKPKNNKLYCYPYSMFTVDNFNGDTEHYKWEDFNNPFSAEFTRRGTVNPRPCMEAYPTGYKNYEACEEYGLIYDNFPICPYVNDTYRAWVSQALPKGIASVGSTIITTALMGGGSLGAMGKALAVGDVVGNITNFAIENEYHKVHSKSVVGSPSNSGMNWNSKRIGFRAISFTVKPEFARIIDEYFTRFGYKVNRVEVPYMHSRKSFNYIKTASCMIKGAIPASDKDKLMQIFNNGVTLWHDTENVGNYEVDNSIII